MRLLAVCFCLLLSVPAMAGVSDDAVKKVQKTLKRLHVDRHAHLDGEQIVCSDKDAYNKMTHIMNDKTAALAFFLEKREAGICKYLADGTNILVDKISVEEPMAFHLEGDTKRYWVLIEGVEAP